jgi:hypothetical protein
MIGSLKLYNTWEEPMLGELFGSFYGNAPQYRLHHRGYIASKRYRENWLQSIRNFVLDNALRRYPGMTPEVYLLIKEPFGSMGAPLLLEALPESRVIFLVRDPRDVLASYLDAVKRGNWVHKGHIRKGIVDSYETEFADADRQPDLYIESKAELLMKNMMGAKRAYEAHRGPKVLVRYEELLTDTLSTMRRIFAVLGLPADEEDLGRVVEQHSWENIPEEQKGEGKFFRKATPGSWLEILTPEQVKTAERITAPILKEFYGD